MKGQTLFSVNFFVPGPGHYDNGYFSNHPQWFANISITGEWCQCCLSCLAVPNLPAAMRKAWNN